MNVKANLAVMNTTWAVKIRPEKIQACKEFDTDAVLYQLS